ncbi:MAG TPA: hypothetical protein VN033_05360 [Vulgatibacter sp.]|nr:hypothetical protein [Vulgatibacter sp.]
MQSSRPSNVERVEVPKVDQVVKTDSIRPERIPEAVKHLIQIDLCTSARARCD